MSSRYIRLAILALVVTSTMGGNCDPKSESFFSLIGGGSLTGTVTGQVTVDGTARSGVTVALREGSTTIGTTTTGTDGRYTFENVTTGTKTVVITPATGTTCADTEESVTVPAGGTATANFACTTPEPETGTVTGTVTVNGTGESGVAVTLREGTTVIATTTTGTGGTYTFTNVATGAKNVSITSPEGATCPGPQDVTVTSGGTATANFPCTRPSGDFTVVLNNPPPGWLHDMPGISSLECKVIQTSPAQPGASFSAATTGPTEDPDPSGVVTSQPVTGTLDANGRAQLQVRINRLGTYQNVVTVTVGSVSRSATQTITVLPTPNTCPLLPSSIRFKRGVRALLPDDVRPLGLRPVAFRYIEPYGNPAVPQIGLIAEEVAEVFPEAVLVGAEGRPEAIDYRVLTGEVAEAMVARSARAFEAAVAGLAADW